MAYGRKWFLGLNLLALFSIMGAVASASDQLRVYTVKNIATEVEDLAKDFTSRHPGNPVFVTGGVPEQGFTQFASGAIDLLICPQGQLDETKLLNVGRVFRLKGTTVGLYGMAIVVNSALPVTELTLDEVRKLFVGEYTNWVQLGGPNESVKVYTREPNAGASVYIRSRVLGDSDFTSSATRFSFDKEIIRQISKSIASVGYVRVNRLSGPSVRAIALKKEAGLPGVTPSEQNVSNGTYPLTVTLAAHWNVSSDKAPSIEQFVRFCKDNQVGLK
jgi:phosphate transport system substrate-binding protein